MTLHGIIEIIAAAGGVIIGLYIIAVVLGSVSYSLNPQSQLKLSSTWNTTQTNVYDGVSLTGIIPTLIIPLSILLIFFGSGFGRVNKTNIVTIPTTAEVQQQIHITQEHIVPTAPVVEQHHNTNSRWETLDNVTDGDFKG